jgi:hypothetical protein
MKFKTPREEEEAYYRKLEQDWKKSLPRYSPAELLEIFPEGREAVERNLQEARQEHAEHEKELRESLKQFEDHPDGWFMEEYLEAFEAPEYEERKKRIRKLESFLSKKKSDNWQDFQRKLEIAREYPIERLAEQQLELKRASPDRKVALCPFHNENTPSFYLFLKQNSYHCFGCQAHGDVISLTEQLYSVDFKDAVEMLQN